MSYLFDTESGAIPAAEVLAPDAQDVASLSWYAIKVRPRWEKLAAAALRAKEYDEFLPLYRKLSRWSDRTKSVDLPIFPGYVFCRANLSEGPPLVTTPGVIGILKFGDRAAVIEDKEIEALKTVLRSAAPAMPWPYLHAGQRVRVLSGALLGVEGILVRTKSDCRIVLSVDALCRSMAVEVQRDSVMPIGPPFAAPNHHEFRASVSTAP